MRYKKLILLLLLVILLKLLSFLFIKADVYTSSNMFCGKCHLTEYASWQKSIHFNIPEEGSCMSCHNAPKGQGYYLDKVKSGLRHISAYLFKDSLEYSYIKARDEQQPLQSTISCVHCHDKLFSLQISEAGEKAHLRYVQNQEKMKCISCHYNVGHGIHFVAGPNKAIFEVDNLEVEKYEVATKLSEFKNYKECIPGTSVSFNMIAVKGGALPDSNQTGTQKQKSFFMSQTEVSWDEYLAFMRDAENEGRSDDNVDGISGATPPWGNPDQGWGMGARPAITMTPYAAQAYCVWLSNKTGKKYRLPTEAEWMFVASQVYTEEGLSQAMVNARPHGKRQTQLPGEVEKDLMGFSHIFGNVKEFCSDRIKVEGSSVATAQNEYVIKGGSFKSSLDDLHPAFREYTNSEKWFMSDPQIPKSKWWYSDCNDVGFRVVLDNTLKH